MMMDSDEQGRLKVRFHRSARIRPGKVQDVLKLAGQVTEYLRRARPEFPAEAYTEQFGAVGTIHLFWDVESMAALETARSQLLSEVDYMTMAKQAGRLFIEGSARDQLLMMIPRR